MNDFHKIGSFIKLKMMEQNKSIQSLAEESGYSTKDINCTDVDPIECMGEFTKEENKDMLLDYIDRYVDLKEAT